MRGTSNDADEIVEADAPIALVGRFEGRLQLRILVLGQNAPLLVEELVEVRTAFPSHRVIFLSSLNFNAFINSSHRMVKIPHKESVLLGRKSLKNHIIFEMSQFLK